VCAYLCVCVRICVYVCVFVMLCRKLAAPVARQIRLLSHVYVCALRVHARLCVFECSISHWRLQHFSRSAYMQRQASR